MESVSDQLLRAVCERYGIVGRARAIAAGVSGASLWRLDSDPPVLVRVDRYYGLPQVLGNCRIAQRLSRQVPEVITPILGSDQAAAFLWDGRPVSVWPFVEGDELDRHDRIQLQQAAWLLARLHRAGAGPVDHGDRTIPGEDRAADAADLLPDSALDDWLRSWRAAGGRAEPRGWMHGDFFWSNILCRQGMIVGLIDWEETWCGSLIVELAWSMWEFGKSPRGDALLPDRAGEFLASYTAAGGPVEPSSDLIPIVQERLRRDIAFFQWVASLGHPVDPVDHQAKFDAFASLQQQAEDGVVGLG